MKKFSSLFASDKRSAVEEEKFATYLKTMKGFYRPKVYRSIPKPASQSGIHVVNLKNGDTLYRNDRPLVYVEDGKIQLLCSANRDNYSPLELARAFLYDYSRKKETLQTQYINDYKIVGLDEDIIDNRLLLETSSNIDELLTPRMKLVFAKGFKDYFDNYATSYLADQDTSYSSLYRCGPVRSIRIDKTIN